MNNCAGGERVFGWMELALLLRLLQPCPGNATQISRQGITETNTTVQRVCLLTSEAIKRS